MRGADIRVTKVTKVTKLSGVTKVIKDWLESMRGADIRDTKATKVIKALPLYTLVILLLTGRQPEAEEQIGY
jgi:hypothetical protein